MTISARRVGAALLRSSGVNRAVRALARLRGHRLVLVYHRLGPTAGAEIVPSVPPDVFRAQLQVLVDVTHVVSLDEVLSDDTATSADDRRPRVALTFDDDLPSHVREALPLLNGMGVPATFFLSGRALHGCGAYWFQDLGALLAAHGERRTAALLGIPVTPNGALALVCERNPDLRRRVTALAAELPAPEVLQSSDIAALGAAGMAVGFHTVDHDPLPDLPTHALERAVSRGREELAAAAGAPVRYFAYPHGKADARSAAAVRTAGFEAAFTGAARPLRRVDDRYQLGRWEPGALAVDDLLVRLAVRLHRDAPRVGTGVGSW